MRGEAKRLTLILGVALLAAVIAGSVIAPELPAAPKASLEFTITTNEKLVMFGSTGTFHAKGALRDSGRAEGYDWYPDLELIGEHGTMLITTSVPPGQSGSTREGTFTIVEADGQYGNLVGVTGAYEEHLTGGGRDVGPLTARAQGSGSSHGIQRTLKGVLPQ